MIGGIGVDLCEIARIRRSLDRWDDRFAQRILVGQELERLSGLPTTARAPYLARQFAAKEAVAKVLGTGMGAGITFRQIQVLRKPGGAPYVVLTGKAAARAAKLSINHWHLSISDERDYAVAFAVGENAPG